MKWITCERPKIDRIACPWLVARSIAEAPEFLWVPDGGVMRLAQGTGMPPRQHPDNNNGYGFLDALGDSLIIGPTVTNINDFRAILIA